MDMRWVLTPEIVGSNPTVPAKFAGYLRDVGIVVTSWSADEEKPTSVAAEMTSGNGGITIKSSRRRGG